MTWFEKIKNMSMEEMANMLFYDIDIKQHGSIEDVYFKGKLYNSVEDLIELLQSEVDDE